MPKRLSKRRWKAKALLGQKIPWSAIVDHRLQAWGLWERRFDYQDAYLLPAPKLPRPIHYAED